MVKCSSISRHQTYCYLQQAVALPDVEPDRKFMSPNNLNKTSVQLMYWVKTHEDAAYAEYLKETAPKTFLISVIRFLYPRTRSTFKPDTC